MRSWRAAVRAAVEVGAPSSEDDASLPSRDEVSLSDESLLIADKSFSSTPSARKSSPACVIGDTARSWWRILLPNTGSGVVAAEVKSSVPPGSGASPSSLVSPCSRISGSGGDGTPARSVASQVTSLASTALFASVGIRKESLRWSLPDLR